MSSVIQRIRSELRNGCISEDEAEQRMFDYYDDKLRIQRDDEVIEASEKAEHGRG